LNGTSASAISWIGSLQIFFLFAGTLFGGPLFDRYGAVVCILLSMLEVLGRFADLVASSGPLAFSYPLHLCCHDDKSLH
jgi:MFS family permease